MSPFMVSQVGFAISEKMAFIRSFTIRKISCQAIPVGFDITTFNIDLLVLYIWQIAKVGQLKRRVNGPSFKYDIFFDSFLKPYG